MALRRLFSNNPVVVLVGPRGAGKTTLAREFGQRWRATSYFFDLRSAADRTRLEDPKLALSQLQGLIILDEVHRVPNVLATVRELSSRSWNPARFLILSSIATDRLRKQLEPLADLSSYYELPGLLAPDLPVPQANRLWLRGDCWVRSTRQATKRASNGGTATCAISSSATSTVSPPRFPRT